MYGNVLLGLCRLPEKDLNQGKYSRTMVNTKDAEDTTLKPNSGTIIEQDHIILFKDVC